MATVGVDVYEDEVIDDTACLAAIRATFELMIM
jgi:hypothetical protein